MAESCGTPTPATMRVVQIEPGPMPTLTASAPASISACVPSAVATLPAMMRTELDSFLARVTASSTRCEWPCAVSMTSRSTPASISRSARSKPSSPTLVAAATRRRPCASLAACGLSCDFSMSLTVIRPTQLPCVIDDQQLFDAVLVQQALGFVLVDILLDRDQVLPGHQLVDLLRRDRRRSARRGWSGCRPAGRSSGRRCRRSRPPECPRCE